MGLEVVNQETVLDRALQLIREAKFRIWITSPWITQRAVYLLLRDAIPRLHSDRLDVRIVYRVKEPADLEITDLEALKSLEDAGCQVRFSTRLHAKLILVDDTAAIVSSSNLTATAGFGTELPAAWRNEELGVLIRDEPTQLSDLKGHFGAIWDAATSVGADTVGITMDFPTVLGFGFVAIRDVRIGEYVTCKDSVGRSVIGRIAELTAYNRSFPRMNQTMWLTQGFPASGDRRSSVEVPDLQSLFSQPSKEQGFLVTKTFFEPESVFHIARVEVLKCKANDRLGAPTVPVVPGADVLHAPSDMLSKLLGNGDVILGTVLHHPDVTVALRGDEILSKHLAVLGMTGSGKSNAIKVLIRSLIAQQEYENLRVVVLDTHHEYVPLASGISSNTTVLDVELRRCILDEDVVKEVLRLPRRDDPVIQKILEMGDRVSADATLEDLLATIESEISLGGPTAGRLKRFIDSVRGQSDFCLWPEEGATIVRCGGSTEDIATPGLYILDLRQTSEFEARSVKAAVLMGHLFRRNKRTSGSFPALVVIDEAQNYAPEQQTGWLARVGLLSTPSLLSRLRGGSSQLASSFLLSDRLE
jgi:hypothetical protein